MKRTSAPPCIWDLCCEYVCEIRSQTSHPRFQLGCRTPYEVVTGNTQDISECLEHSFYYVVWYINSNDSFPTTKGEKLARWCGVSHRVGQAMCYWILTVAGTLISRTTVRPVTDEELRKPDVREQIHNFKLKLNESLKVTSEIASETTKVPHERVLWDIDDEGTEGDAGAFHEEVPTLSDT